MQRPAMAAMAAGPAPLMSAARAETARGKGIPAGTATAVEVFRHAAAGAIPAAGGFRMPTA